MARLLVLGGTGFLGQAVLRQLPAGSYNAPTSVEANLCDPRWTRWLTASEAPVVLHLAKPRSDGIRTMADTPASFADQMLEMDLQVLRGCVQQSQFTMPKLVCLGSVCSYPAQVPEYPIPETQLWAGYPESTNAAYGIAKRMQLTLLQAYRRERGLNGIHLIPSNLYGPGDRSGHVIPSLIAKVRQALVDGGPVIVWGYPRVTRSFIYVDDAAAGVVRAVERYNDAAPLNLCTAEEITMERLVGVIADRLGYTGKVVFDRTKPTGDPRRCFSTAAMTTALDWYPPTPFEVGLHATIDWSVAHVPVV